METLSKAMSFLQGKGYVEDFNLKPDGLHCVTRQIDIGPDAFQVDAVYLAFRVKDDAAQLKFRHLIEGKGFNITPQIDRNYFHSLYFRELGGVLFEIATDNPGFMVDEPLEQLGQNLKLPEQHEPMRKKIMMHLPALQ